jgi:hypothetical protein
MNRTHYTRTEVHNRFSTKVIICLGILAFLLTGCVEESVDKAIEALNVAIRRLENQSVAWQGVLKDLEQDLIKEGREIIANEVAIVLSRTASDVAIEARCTVSFIRDLVKEELIKIRARLTGEELVRTPRFCNPSPAEILYDQVQDGSVRNYEVSGYNLDDVNVKVVLVDNQNNETDVSFALADPSSYIISVNLGANGVPLTPDSDKLIFRLPGGEHSVNINQPIVVEPKPELAACYWSAHVSEETPSEICIASHAIAGVRCSGSYCDSKELYCCPYLPYTDPEAHYFWSPTISEEGPENQFSYQDGWLAGIFCEHDYCDNITLSVLATPNLINKRTTCSFRSYFSEEGIDNQFICEERSFVSGLACTGEYCDSISLMCCQADFQY